MVDSTHMKVKSGDYTYVETGAASALVKGTRFLWIGPVGDSVPFGLAPEMVLLDLSVKRNILCLL